MLFGVQYRTGAPLWAFTSHLLRFRLMVIFFGLDSLCAGSLLLFSLWAPIFQDKLGFSQMQINAVSIAGALGMYLPYVHLFPLISLIGPSLQCLIVVGIAFLFLVASAIASVLQNSPYFPLSSSVQHTSSLHMPLITGSRST